MSDSPEFFELDPEEDDIVAQRLRRASKARRSARETEAPPETVAPVSARGTVALSDDEGSDCAPSDAADADFEVDPPDDDIFARRRQPSAKKRGAKAPVPPSTGRWFLVAILVGVLAGVVLGSVWLSNKDKGASTADGTSTEMDAAQVQAAITQLKAQVAASPDYDTYLSLGKLQYQTSDLEGMRQSWTAASALDPGRPEAWFYLGMWYYPSLDPPDTAGSLQALTKVVQLAPDSEWGQTAQSHLDRLGDGSTAPADGGSSDGGSP